MWTIFSLYHARALIHELKDKVVDENVSNLFMDLAAHSSLVPMEQISDPFLYFEVLPRFDTKMAMFFRRNGINIFCIR